MIAATQELTVSPLFALIGLIVVIVPIAVSSRNKATIAALKEQASATSQRADEMTKMLEAERTERRDQEARCAEQVAELRGEVRLLREGVAHDIAARVVESIRAHMDGS